MEWLSFSDHPIAFTILIGVLVEIGAIAQIIYKQIYKHPLSRYPGPAFAALTEYRRSFIESVLKKPWPRELQDLHKKYGPIVRVGPNELHFSTADAYKGTAEDRAIWDKDETKYKRFGEDNLSFALVE